MALSALRHQHLCMPRCLHGGLVALVVLVVNHASLSTRDLASYAFGASGWYLRDATAFCRKGIHTQLAEPCSASGPHTVALSTAAAAHTLAHCVVQAVCGRPTARHVTTLSKHREHQAATQHLVYARSPGCFLRALCALDGVGQSTNAGTHEAR